MVNAYRKKLYVLNSILKFSSSNSSRRYSLGWVAIKYPTYNQLVKFLYVRKILTIIAELIFKVFSIYHFQTFSDFINELH